MIAEGVIFPNQIVAGKRQRGNRAIIRGHKRQLKSKIKTMRVLYYLVVDDQRHVVNQKIVFQAAAISDKTDKE